MSRPRNTILGALLLAAIGPIAAAGRDADDGPSRDDRLGLADLPAYAAALAGRPTADDARPSDPPAVVGFRDLWDRPTDLLGRRVTIRGRLERTFRQGPVGSFPPLAESWIFSRAGDPFCIVYPRPATNHLADPGRAVRFTGTFLETVRYAAGDGERLAPLIVGDRPPEIDRTPPSRTSEARPSPDRAQNDRRPDPRPQPAENPALALALATIAALLIAARHVAGHRLRRQPPRRPRLEGPDLPDPPLRFVDSPVDEP